MRVALRYDLLRFSLCSADLWERNCPRTSSYPNISPPPLQIHPPKLLNTPPPKVRSESIHLVRSESIHLHASSPCSHQTAALGSFKRTSTLPPWLLITNGLAKTASCGNNQYMCSMLGKQIWNSMSPHSLRWVGALLFLHPNACTRNTWVTLLPQGRRTNE